MVSSEIADYDWRVWAPVAKHFCVKVQNQTDKMAVLINQIWAHDPRLRV